MDAVNGCGRPVGGRRRERREPETVVGVVRGRGAGLRQHTPGSHSQPGSVPTYERGRMGKELKSLSRIVPKREMTHLASSTARFASSSVTGVAYL